MIDPYHYVEYDAVELRELCAAAFDRVEVLGLHGSARYLSIVEAERRELAGSWPWIRFACAACSRDGCASGCTTGGCATTARRPRPGALEIDADDFRLSGEQTETALDLVAVCDLPAE